jgi:hypothetical protein
MQSPPSQAKVFNDVKDFSGFVLITDRWFLRDHQINVNVCMNEVTVTGSSDRPFNAHQTVLLCPLKHALCFQRIFGQVTRIFGIRFDPADILAPAKSPSL